MGVTHKRRRGDLMKAPIPRTLLDDLLSSLQQLNSSDPRVDYLLSEVTSKYMDPDPKTAARRRERAIEKWLATEERNEKTNSRLYTRVLNCGKFTSDDVIQFARSKIADVLGDFPGIFTGSFTSGASMSLPRVEEGQSLKYVFGNTVTEAALQHARRMLEQSPLWQELSVRDFEVVDGNSLFTVPKNADIDRCSAKEPDLNMYLQKGVGGHIRQNLKRFGIDLDDQSKNRRLALQGSVDRHLATIDLSSASDSITRAAVFALLPTEWACYMDDIRSPFTFIPETGWHENQMFSSMGNAFTFELETLIFWALTRAVGYFLGVKGTISVYGDDIICPSAICRTLVRVFGYFGFVINTKKSHWADGFRESCGGHYLDGVDITPFYVKRPIKTVRDVIHLANAYRLWLERGSCAGVLDPDHYGIWLQLARCVPSLLRGGWDTQRTDILVSHGRPPRGRLARTLVQGDPSRYYVGRVWNPVRKDWDQVRSSNLDHRAYVAEVGAYMRWLDETSRGRSFDRFGFLCPVVTSVISAEAPGEDVVRRVSPKAFAATGRTTYVFPQEVGLHGVALIVPQ